MEQHASIWTQDFVKMLLNYGVGTLFAVLLLLLLGYLILKYFPVLNKLQLVLVQMLEANHSINDTIKKNNEIITENTLTLKDTCEVIRNAKR